MMKKPALLILLSILLFQCTNVGQEAEQESVSEEPAQDPPFSWNNATVYFLLTDRFNNGDPDNDVNFGRNESTGTLRGFEGGDIKGITQKIEEGYFDQLGVNAIWLTPVVEQIHGPTDEGTGITYAYHGYWARDWTTLDPNFGTEEDLLDMVNTAHEHGIRILLDVVLNHTGPVTEKDKQWPDNWVRTGPTCTYRGYETTVECTLVENLPDIYTENEEPVDLPDFLLEKWEKEGRLEMEQKELNDFFERTGYPRAPKYYLIKWLTDFIRKFGIDGFRVDTAKHTEASVWAILKEEAEKAFKEWKSANPDFMLDDNDFFMVGEVYNYSAAEGKNYDYGDSIVNFFDHGFESLINFDFKGDAEGSYEQLFIKYDTLLHGGLLEGLNVLNYLSSHDDGAPFDPDRQRALEAGTKLLLSPGAVQIYYGDETGRLLKVEGAQGDANLRSFMNWEAIESDSSNKEILGHWSKLGLFRNEHIAVGAGKHQQLQKEPYIFSRVYDKENITDMVLVALDMPAGKKNIPVFDLIEDGSELHDYYSGKTVSVEDGSINLDTPYSIVLIGERK